MKLIVLTLTARVPDSVEADNVAQQIGDAIDPDGWNWDVSAPAVLLQVENIPEPEPEDD